MTQIQNVSKISPVHSHLTFYHLSLTSSFAFFFLPCPFDAYIYMEIRVTVLKISLMMSFFFPEHFSCFLSHTVRFQVLTTAYKDFLIWFLLIWYCITCTVIQSVPDIVTLANRKVKESLASWLLRLSSSLSIERW